MSENPLSDRPLPEDALVSVVLPVYNEAKVLPELARRVGQAVTASGADYEIVFVDDGSRDASPQTLDDLAAADPRIRVLHLSRNFGHQAAVQAGLGHTRGDAIVLMDSDLQDVPEAIGQFVAKWRAGYDVVYAVRTQRKENIIKRSMFSAFHRLMAAMASVPIPADAGIFGLIDRRVASEILNLDERDRYFPGLRSWVGFRQTGVIVERSARYDDHPRVSMTGLFRLAKTAMFSFSTMPLTLFNVIGFLALTLFMGLSGFCLICKVFTDLAVPGWASYILVGSFFGALNAMGISILGEYVVRIYDQVRGRPLYLVDRTANMDWHSQGAMNGRVSRSRDRSLEPSLPVPMAADASEEELTRGDAPYVDLMEDALDLLNRGPAGHYRANDNATAEAEPVVIPFHEQPVPQG